MYGCKVQRMVLVISYKIFSDETKKDYSYLGNHIFLVNTATIDRNSNGVLIFPLL